MTKQIIPQFPFNDKFSKGYVSINNKNRRIIQLYGNDGKNRKTMSFPRYLKSVELGFEIPRQFEVDHINNDHLDDRVENLTLLTPKENKEKYFKDNKPTLVICECSECKKSFVLIPSAYKSRVEKAEKLFCSRSCSSKNLVRSGRIPSIADNTGNALSLVTLSKILEMKKKGFSNRKIREVIGKSHATIAYHILKHTKQS